MTKMEKMNAGVKNGKEMENLLNLRVKRDALRDIVDTDIEELIAKNDGFQEVDKFLDYLDIIASELGSLERRVKELEKKMGL